MFQNLKAAPQPPARSFGTALPLPSQSVGASLGGTPGKTQIQTPQAPPRRYVEGAQYLSGFSLR